eukprot:TRINITY_DN76166_c0_g1_i1.p1 TRINITY_DN76166_c0_g1~~TRINITY_DN76166_c0_g1_i1.p1  ORF type:complete len:620 (+),score=167.96 TRINITY_DN76166_c0_g1_i1:27-1886(+)
MNSVNRKRRACGSGELPPPPWKHSSPPRHEDAADVSDRDARAEADKHVMELCKAFTVSRAGVLVVDVLALEKVKWEDGQEVRTAHQFARNLTFSHGRSIEDCQLADFEDLEELGFPEEYGAWASVEEVRAIAINGCKKSRTRALALCLAVAVAASGTNCSKNRQDISTLLGHHYFNHLVEHALSLLDKRSGSSDAPVVEGSTRHIKLRNQNQAAKSELCIDEEEDAQQAGHLGGHGMSQQLRSTRETELRTKRPQSTLRKEDAAEVKPDPLAALKRKEAECPAKDAPQELETAKRRRGVLEPQESCGQDVQRSEDQVLRDYTLVSERRLSLKDLKDALQEANRQVSEEQQKTLTISAEWEKKHRLLGQELDKVRAELAAERAETAKARNDLSEEVKRKNKAVAASKSWEEECRRRRLEVDTVRAELTEEKENTTKINQEVAEEHQKKITEVEHTISASTQAWEKQIQQHRLQIDQLRAQLAAEKAKATAAEASSEAWAKKSAQQASEAAQLRSQLAAEVSRAAKQREEANSKQAEAQQSEHEAKEALGRLERVLEECKALADEKEKAASQQHTKKLNCCRPAFRRQNKLQVTCKRASLTRLKQQLIWSGPKLNLLCRKN